MRAYHTVCPNAERLGFFYRNKTTAEVGYKTTDHRTIVLFVVLSTALKLEKATQQTRPENQATAAVGRCLQELRKANEVAG